MYLSLIDLPMYKIDKETRNLISIDMFTCFIDSDIDICNILIIIDF